MYDYLLRVISEKVPLTPKDEEYCKEGFEYIKVGKNSILESIDKTPLHLYFIIDGFTRLYFYDQEGNEITSRINSPGTFITPFLSFINQRPSTENLACVTDAELLRISVQQLKALIAGNEKFKEFSLIIFEQAIVSTELRANDLATLNAKERYKKLLSEQPEILQHVPIQYIASYLGIQPESLSRIRREK